MQVVILMAFVLALTLRPFVLYKLSAPAVLAAAAVYLLGVVALGAVNASLSLRGMAGPSAAHGRAMRRHGVLSILTQLWLVAGLAGLLLLGYARWDWARAYPLLGDVVALAPFVAGLVLMWLLDYPFYRSVRRVVAAKQAAAGLTVREGWRLGEYLDYNIRHHFLFMAVPIGLIVLAGDMLEMYLAPALPQRIAEYVISACSIAAAGGVFLLAPLLVSKIWKTEPLPPGPLRDRLEAICRQQKLRYRNILIWRSGGMITNAGVMGLVGPLRYILLSDAMLEHPDQRHVEAIFGHEAGHIVSHHIAYSVLFMLASAAICISSAELLVFALRWGQWEWVSTVLGLGMLVAVWGVGIMSS